MTSSQSTSVGREDATYASDIRTSSRHDLNPGQDLVDYAKTYAKEKPEVVALWCFGVGFILGWKLKPW